MEKIFEINSDWEKQSLVNKHEYKELYSDSITENENFWKKNEKHGKCNF